MSRFVTLADSITAVATVGPVGIRDTNPADRRIMVQFAATGPFVVRAKATLDFDFGTNLGQNWFDVTDRLRTIGDSAADFVIVGSKYQRRSDKTLGLPIDLDGVYAFDNDFIPAAVQFEVSTVSSGSHLKVLFGV